jgi:hypothetical protein
MAFVQLDDDLLDRARHCLETPLSAALNGVGAFKRDHIAVPVGAFGAGRGLCSLDRYNFVDFIHCVRSFSDQTPIYSKRADLAHITPLWYKGSLQPFVREGLKSGSGESLLSAEAV